MKIVIDTPEDFKKWLAEKPTLVQAVKTSTTPEVKTAEGIKKSKETVSIKKDTTVVATTEMK
jgi:cytochrome c oxidase subunit 2